MFIEIMSKQIQYFRTHLNWFSIVILLELESKFVKGIYCLLDARQCCRMLKNKYICRMKHILYDMHERTWMMKKITDESVKRLPRYLSGNFRVSVMWKIVIKQNAYTILDTTKIKKTYLETYKKFFYRNRCS